MTEPGFRLKSAFVKVGLSFVHNLEHIKKEIIYMIMTPQNLIS